MLESAILHYQEQQQIKVRTMKAVRRLWRGMTDDFDLSWSRIGLDVGDAIMAGQLAASMAAQEHLLGMGDELDLGNPVGFADPFAFVGWTSEGVELDRVTRTSIVQAKQLVGAGVDVTSALTQAGSWLEELTANEITGAASGMSTATVTSTPRTGYVRMLNLPSCKDCIILAGRWYRWNQGFQRHGGCDCEHIPARESMTELRTDPYEAFNSLTKAEQDKIFGKADAQAIRDGADIYRVVNVRNRGLSDGRSHQARRYGTPTRMTVDDINKVATSREDAIRMLTQEGYILPEGQVPGGTIRGNDGLSEFGGLMAGTMGRGGTRKGATLSYREAIRTGDRDPLNPATQTAAERRLHVAYLNWEAVKAGRNPFSTSGRVRLTTEQRDQVEQTLHAYVRNLKNEPDQVRDLAHLLGLI
ncbi:hypothetical protein [Pseudoclavibacter sp. JSM 162008]|uniref:hypothetical protein n=1 Tax=Pseudoclavibacter sp. JSM 162008 TaxID=3229855 RepID=UPI003525E002